MKTPVYRSLRFSAFKVPQKTREDACLLHPPVKDTLRNRECLIFAVRRNFYPKKLTADLKVSIITNMILILHFCYKRK
ncbi:transposase [Bacillus licheniformis]|jgi:hypothetical protein|nr:hypothetical protein DT075_32600 [Bacillus licheniformis]